jgi:hypothetical protein
MTHATAHPNHQCVSSEDIHGTEVYGADGKHIGEIDHLIIDKLSGRVSPMPLLASAVSWDLGTATIQCHGPLSRTTSR